MSSANNGTTSSRFLPAILKKVIKSVRENGRIKAIILCVVLFVAGVVDIITVIVMTVQNANGKAEALNRNVAILVVIAGAVAVVTALYIWHKLAGYASALEVFARGQEDRDLIPSENALVSKVIKSLRENWRKIVLLMCGLLFLAGAMAITTVIVMTLQNADDNAGTLNRDVDIVVVILGALAMVTALYIWHKLAGHASTLEVFLRGEED